MWKQSTKPGDDPAAPQQVYCENVVAWSKWLKIRGDIDPRDWDGRSGSITAAHRYVSLNGI